jgi:predicted nucleotidyltransferase
MKSRNNLIAFAMSFASYFVQNIKLSSSIRNIILFGSVARDDFDKESDIDIFIDSKDDIEKEANGILDSFYKSFIYIKYWKLLGIENEISTKVGNLDDWDLKRSIVSHGILLYGKYSAEIGGKLYSIFMLDISGKRNEKLRIWRKIYGYKQKVKGREYMQKGLLDELSARRMGPAIFILPIQNANKMRQFLNENKVKHKVMELQTDSFE